MVGPKTDNTATILNEIKTNKVKKRTLFNKTRQYNIHLYCLVLLNSMFWGFSYHVSFIIMVFTALFM